MHGAVVDLRLSVRNWPGRTAPWVAAALALVFGAAAMAQTETAQSPAAVVPSLVMGAQLNVAWRMVTLPQQKPPVTRFMAEQVGGRWAVRIDADASYGNLVHEPAPGTWAQLPRQLAWSWRLQTPNPAVDLSTKTGDDLPAKVCLSFDLPLEKVPFFERQLMRIARARSGENLSAATLCWVWGGVSEREKKIDNAYTRRVRFIVLRNQTDPLNTWLDERRDVAADFKRAFGDETGTPPPLTALIVGGDGDNTGVHSVAFVADLRWLP